MKGQLIFFGKLILIWLIVFLFQRLLFIFHFWSDFSGNFGELIVLPFHALRLDLSAIGYLTGISFVFSFFSFFMGEKGLRYLQTFIHFYFWVIFTLAALVVCAEIVTYIEWKTKLSSKIFIHLTTPSEVFRTASFSYTVWFFLPHFTSRFWLFLVCQTLQKIRLKSLFCPGKSGLFMASPI